MTIEKPRVSPSAGRPLGRRDFLRATVAVSGIAVLYSVSSPISAMAADEDVQTFTRLSEFLTGHQLDPVLGARYRRALAKRSKTLQSDVDALQQLISQSGAANMDALLALPLNDGLKMAATKIVSAWYLGVVGDPEDAELIAYQEALMYRPTEGILPIPTYGPGPNAWGPKPDSKI